MDGWEALDADRPENAGRKRSAWRVLGVAALVLIALTVLVVWRLGRSAKPTGMMTPAIHGIALAVRTFEANRASAYAGPEFVVGIDNVGDREVRVTDVALLGWQATSAPVTIAAAGSAQVRVDVRVDCRQTPPSTDALIVHATSSGQATVQTLQLAAIPDVLTGEYERLCAAPPLRTPDRQDLEGAWSVDDTNIYARQMLIKFNPDGTFAMDPYTMLFSHPGAYGRFTYRAGNLTLAVQGGPDCPRGDRSRWHVGLMNNGRLRMTVISVDHSRCGVAAGEVWVGRRVDPARIE